MSQNSQEPERITAQLSKIESFLKISTSDEEIERQFEAAGRECKRQKRLALLAAARVPMRHSRFVETDNIIEGWDTGLGRVHGISMQGGITTILGGRGTGKTQMAVCLIKRMVKAEITSMYTKAIEISMRIRASYNTEGDTEQGAVRDYLKPYLLVVDALEERSGNEWEDRIFNHILDKRYDNLTPTVLISNETADQFKRSMGSSVISRIIETGNKVVCDWESFRGKKAVSA